MSKTEVVVYENPDLLAAAAAARLVTRIVDVQAAKGSASVVLTGGGTGIAILRELRDSSARDAIDWSRLDVYWGDERFVPADSDERNEKQAREALLDHVPLDPKRVHAMAPSDGEFGDDVDAAAAAYAEILTPEVPAFDIMLLGLGGEGHTASIFPDSPAVHEKERSVVAVRDCPKPPPTRISLTLPAIRRAQDIWLVTGGDAKADAVAQALAGAGEVEIPVAGARGSRRTLWLLDRGSASKLTKVYQPPTG
ncbi:6-phosphogluconolactonase [Amycolatopsis keratiniphila]|uniref:6-phosphogluconolactonase n=1 Tax=Amycolatopsis keratiniphila subsp. keratiniphila TaxID=227715 RepID=A0A1W2LLZ7_9PSEU|nr:6-phosphogluconolactonase [Amycolatopsis keratiniphila]OLZ44610.1 6-phosphogluconolactonase [Amycolatopsis keratiniphila subsp. nogabecina]ONF64013.1 6-phosphogluconolactonase [Amycolatopsis keratiniphila subsp. keratiniphila]SDU31443.1 6-phosphogluconolactonase [Amycolatopsis keratiniphila]